MTFALKCWKSGPCVDGVQCCCTFVPLCCLQPGWRKSNRRFDQGKASLWCGLPCGGSDLILTLCPTSGLRGCVCMERSVCLFCALAGSSVSESLLSFQAVETEVPANEASFIRACVVWADQAIYVLPQQKTVPFASHSFHIVPSLSSANADHILLCLQVLLSLRTLHFNLADFDVMADRWIGR